MQQSASLVSTVASIEVPASWAGAAETRASIKMANVRPMALMMVFIFDDFQEMLSLKMGS